MCFIANVTSATSSWDKEDCYGGDFPILYNYDIHKHVLRTLSTILWSNFVTPNIELLRYVFLDIIN